MIMQKNTFKTILFLSLVTASVAAFGAVSDTDAASANCDASWYVGSVSGDTATVVMTPDTHFGCDVYLTSWKMFKNIGEVGLTQTQEK